MLHKLMDVLAATTLHAVINVNYLIMLLIVDSDFDSLLYYCYIDYADVSLFGYLMNM